MHNHLMAQLTALKLLQQTEEPRRHG